MTTIVMYIELALAFGVACCCLVFSIYFIATRPPERRASGDDGLLIESPQLPESRVYGSFNDAASENGRIGRDSSFSEGNENHTSESIWESFQAFVGNINPWKSF